VTSVVVAGAGSIGSLLAAHLARVADVTVLTRREEHAAALREHGLRVSGRGDFTAPLDATADPAALPADAELAILACKGTDLEALAARLEGTLSAATVMTIQNGLGAEELVAGHGEWPLLSAVTFMSGTRHGDAHVEYVLDTATWIGPFRGTTEQDARRVAELVEAGGLKADAFPDLRPAQWSKLIFNATVNGVAALTALPHDFHFDERPRDTARAPALPVDARGRRGAAADRARFDQRRPRARGAAPRRGSASPDDGL
jgi:2-dehydropantoate 2-reductase